MGKVMEVTLMQAKEITRNSWNSTNPSVIIYISDSGIGKTTMAQALAQEEEYRYEAIRAALIDAVELNGIPVSKDGRTIYSAPSWVPEWDEKFVLMLDEVNRGKPDVVQAAFRIAEKRGTDSWKFNPKKHRVIIAINPVGKYNVIPLGLAFINRATVLYIKIDVKDFLMYARKKNFNAKIIEFISANEKMLHVLPKEDDQELDVPWASPRSYEQLSDIMEGQDNKLIPTLATGTIGLEAGAAFIKFINDPDRPVTVSEILDKKYPKPVSDKFKRHQEKSIHKAFATVMDLSTFINAKDGKVDLKLVKDFYKSITANEVKTAFIKGLEQGKDTFDKVVAGLDIEQDLLKIGKDFQELKKKTK